MPNDLPFPGPDRYARRVQTWGAHRANGRPPGNRSTHLRLRGQRYCDGLRSAVLLRERSRNGT